MYLKSYWYIREAEFSILRCSIMVRTSTKIQISTRNPPKNEYLSITIEAVILTNLHYYAKILFTCNFLHLVPFITIITLISHIIMYIFIILIIFFCVFVL